MINATASDSYESLYSNLMDNMDCQDYQLRMWTAGKELVRAVTLSKSLSKSTRQTILNSYKEQFKKTKQFE